MDNWTLLPSGSHTIRDKQKAGEHWLGGKSYQDNLRQILSAVEYCQVYEDGQRHIECGLQDSLTHLLSHCTHPMYTLTRTNTHTCLKRYVNTLKPDNLEYYVANCLLTFVTDINNANTWTGLWTEEQRRSLLKLIKEHPRYAGNAAQYGHKWAKAAQRVLIGIGYGARQLIRHKHTNSPTGRS